ncbi:helix-turn-helix domain-containing protein [Streptacidiphilus jiangxiensis]|uniref:HTH cro/C1-type domain-containing protein n=1 Tax=Streptacidiphilus jiangxiensis TaxID=235985 RepID=A0A1H7NWX7_STRJI|nr:helix-turn-helix transcriptional regulator [Streptacidiphilus jiangxiensis]SEL28083.1 hypothetical protein SAMN05414137_107114 [Streptacidiphilus jiangxiensis]
MNLGTEETLRLTVAALSHVRGETQADLAAAIGSTQTQVSRRQAGRTAWTLADCDRLANHYGIPVLVLLAGPTAACEAAFATTPGVAPRREGGA